MNDLSAQSRFWYDFHGRKANCLPDQGNQSDDEMDDDELMGEGDDAESSRDGSACTKDSQHKVMFHLCFYKNFHITFLFFFISY